MKSLTLRTLYIDHSLYYSVRVLKSTRQTPPSSSSTERYKNLSFYAHVAFLHLQSGIGADLYIFCSPELFENVFTYLSATTPRPFIKTSSFLPTQLLARVSRFISKKNNSRLDFYSFALLSGNLLLAKLQLRGQFSASSTRHTRRPMCRHLETSCSPRLGFRQKRDKT